MFKLPGPWTYIGFQLKNSDNFTFFPLANSILTNLNSIADQINTSNQFDNLVAGTEKVPTTQDEILINTSLVDTNIIFASSTQNSNTFSSNHDAIVLTGNSTEDALAFADQPLHSLDPSFNDSNLTNSNDSSSTNFTDMRSFSEISQLILSFIQQYHVYFIIGGSLAIIFIGTCITYCCCCKKKNNKSRNQSGVDSETIGEDDKYDPIEDLNYTESEKRSRSLDNLKREEREKFLKNVLKSKISSPLQQPKTPPPKIDKSTKPMNNLQHKINQDINKTEENNYENIKFSPIRHFDDSFINHDANDENNAEGESPRPKPRFNKGQMRVENTSQEIESEEYPKLSGYRSTIR